MNTIAQIEDCCYIWLYYRKGKTIFLVYTLLCDDLTLITWNLYLMNCY